MRKVAYSMLCGEGPRSDQHEVWKDIDGLLCRMDVQSPTRSLEDAYTSREPDLKRFEKAVAFDQPYQGVAFAIDGALVSLDLFGSAQAFKHAWPKLLRSLALQAIASGPNQTSSSFEPDALGQLLTDLTKASQKSQKAIGLGVDVRLHSRRVSGGALFVDEALVHLCASNDAVH